MKDEGRRMKDERHHTLSFWKQNKEQTNHHVHFFRRERDFCKRRPEACCLNDRIGLARASSPKAGDSSALSNGDMNIVLSTTMATMA
jgi:hypothetical protein